MVTDAPFGFETTTDATGHYQYPDLPPHRYCLQWRKQGYWPTRDECDLTMVRTTAGRDVQRDVALDRMAAIRGRFLDSTTNAPIKGLRLTAAQETYVQGARQWVTYGVVFTGNESGEFEITRLPAGPVYLEVIPVESERIAVQAEPPSGNPFYGRSYYPGVADITMAAPIVLAPGEERSLEIHLTRRQPRTVSVEIAAPDASPDARIDLALERKSLALFPKTVAKTIVNRPDPFTIEGLSEGDYTLGRMVG
jgi:hypothetical protein